jgi:hypothetical protein
MEMTAAITAYPRECFDAIVQPIMLENSEIVVSANITLFSDDADNGNSHCRPSAIMPRPRSPEECHVIAVRRC